VLDGDKYVMFGGAVGDKCDAGWVLAIKM
jgi:hypothetical protein